MSLTQVPSKGEVIGWSPQNLADYLRKLKLSGCDRAVMRSSITGAQFMHMTECELQAFPSLYVPIITKIQSEINKGQQKTSFGQKSKAQKYPKQVFVQEEEVWDSDEFDNESDNDYESPEEETGQDYICALAEPRIAEQEYSDETYQVNHKLPAAAEKIKPPQPSRLAKLPDRRRDPGGKTSEHPQPQPQKRNHTPQRSSKAPAGQSNLHIDRSKKPGQPVPTQRDVTKLKGSAVKAPGSSSSKLHPPRPPKPTDESHSLSPPKPREIIPSPREPTHPAKRNNLIPGPKKDMDPSWYGGKMTRHQAEVVLRDVNKDGAFVVRDSSKGLVEHPYTLMLLNQGKVYNIKIRNQGNSYSLGNGLNNTKSFPGVKEMITHHANTPVPLIDAPDQSSEEKPQCCLLHPAGL